MKTLVLVRHAKSNRDNPFLKDFDRPLSQKGLLDAPMMASRLKNKRIWPDVIVSSEAKRAITTAVLFHQSIDDKNIPFVKDSSLYHAPSAIIMAVFKKYISDFDTVMIVAHNPGITDFLNRYSNLTIDNMPTCGMAICRFDTNLAFDSKPFTLVDFDYPSKI